MSTTATVSVPAGTWVVDPVHSSANFEVEHGEISAFHGGFKPIDAKLIAGDSGLQLEGAVGVASVTINDENIKPHLLSPDFFDADRNPDVRFRSTEITGTPDDLRVVGELSMAGVSKSVEARGRIRGPVDFGGPQKLSLALETAIDRTDYGMDWQMKLPSGQDALGYEIKLTVVLELVQE